MVDLNAVKNPNVIGRDMFILVLANKAYSSNYFGKWDKPGLYFYGQGHDRNYLKNSVYPCNKTGNLAGVFCGALIMYDGWQIKDDYPW